ncbi:MAG TPA: nitroreductase family protein [Sedimentisphaerales bacterium]|nr:nitroreductase family protein [Sedimentisphaerales bacterium]
MVPDFLRRAKRTAVLFRGFVYDFRRMCRHSAAVRTADTKEKLRASIAVHCHAIEKGLARSGAKRDFGGDRIGTLLLLLREYAARYGTDRTWQGAIGALQAYQRANPGDERLPRELDDLVRTLDVPSDPSSRGGVGRMTRDELYAGIRGEFPEFCRVRRSVRQFSHEPPRDAELIEAVRTAQLTPSVCNRQSCRVHIVRDSRAIQEALDVSRSANGFAEEVQRLLVVTSNLACFQSAEERYQCWIDGGMFAMTLVYALHSRGLVSCCLNWNKEPSVDRLFRRVLGVVPEETIVLLIAVGKPLEEFTVPVSARRSLEEILVWR